jgi:hypothetical protein
MPQPINVPGEGIINFPDGMSETQINAEIVKAFPHLGGAKEQALAYAKSPTLGNVETLGQMASGAVATPVAGLSGMAQSAYNVLAPAFGGQEGRPAAQRIEEVQQGLTYQPRSESGKVASQTVAYPFQKFAEGANYLGERTAEATGSPLIGAAVRAAPDLALSLIAPEARGAMSSVGRGMVGSARAAPAAAAGAAANASTVGAQMQAAQQWATSNGLSWGSLPAETRQALANVAKDSTKLESLDPLAVQREANLRKFGMTPTTGMVTRDPLQLRAEQLAKSSDVGSPLRQIDLGNNAALSTAVDSLKSAPAKSELQTGLSVQNALKARLSAVKQNVSKLYREARQAGELQGPVDIASLESFIESEPAGTAVAPIKELVDGIKRRNAIKNENGEIVGQKPITIEQLDKTLRQRVSKLATSPDGTTRFVAGNALKVIDDILDGSGGDAYKAARKARKLQGDEFERTRMVSNLVSNKRRSNSPAVELEDTWNRSVRTGSVADLQAVKASLFKGGKKGVAAWDDLRNATIDYIYDKATTGPKNERGQANVNWGGLRRAIDDIGNDKLEMMVGKVGAKKLNEIVEAAEIAKTEPPMGIKGSPTADKLVTLMDKLGAIPYVGGVADVGKGVVKGVTKLREVGKRGRDLRQATTTPLAKAAQPAAPTLRSMGQSAIRPVAVPAAGTLSTTLQNRPQ